MASGVLAQTSAEATYSHDSIRIGDQFLLNLNFTHTELETDTIVWPEFDNYLTNSVEIIKKSPVRKTIVDSTSGLTQWNQRFILTSFDVGSNPIPAIDVVVNDSIFKTQPYQLLVSTVDVDTTKGIYDIKPIFEVNYTLTNQINDWLADNWHWLVIGLLVIIIAFLIYKFINKPKEEIVIEAPKVPAHITALSVLKALAKSKAWENDDKKGYYSSVTDTVRKYLEERFEILAMEETTIEIIKDLKYSDILSKDKFFLQDILQQADMVKFAKFKPDNKDGEIVLEKSIEFVERTKLMESNQNKSENTNG